MRSTGSAPAAASADKPHSSSSAQPSAAAPANAVQPAAPATTPAPAAQPATPSVAHVIVELKGLKSDSGKIQAALFRTDNGFPEDPNKAAVRKLAKISGKAVDLSFDVDPPGTFVVLVHHDENGDSKMQRGVLGQPAEGWGATRDPSANFGPPSFDDAKMTIKAGETKRVVIKMRY